MGIKLLSKDVVNKIAAGEVVEKPASIVKELVENSIDAGATSIVIDIEKGGISKIVIQDNGCGIHSNEVGLAFTPHATSKLEKIEDLNCLATKGFRGEALATISAVSKVTMVTKTNDEDVGIKVVLEGGEQISSCNVASTTGTKIEVCDVFYNTPARLKFLRKPKSEEGDITAYVEKLMLSHSSIAFKYIIDGKIIYNTMAGCSIVDSIYTIYGKDTASNIIPVNYELGGYKINGFISKPEFGKSNRTYQNLFVNGRYCSNQLVSVAIQNAYENFTMKGKFPFFVLFINLPQSELDVNVHPNKLEVKFADTKKIFQLCSDGTFKALSDFNHIRNIDDNIQQKPSLDVTYANVESEGVSFYLDNKVETQPNTSDIVDGENNKYFESNKTGSFGFERTNNIYSTVLKEKPEETEFFNQNSLIKEIVLEESQPTKGNIPSVEIQQDLGLLFNNDYSIIGKAFNTYLILEQGDKIYFIDQHAAHERAKYDELIKELDNKSLKTQNLLFPYSFNVSATEANFILENIDTLNSFGIEIYEFGQQTFKISAVPMILSEINISKFIEEMLKNITGLVKSPREIIKEKFMQMACKSAVKGGDDLKDLEIKALLDTLKDKTKVLLCPHGRPIVIDIDKKQIEKWFKRIV